MLKQHTLNHYLPGVTMDEKISQTMLRVFKKLKDISKAHEDLFKQEDSGRVLSDIVKVFGFPGTRQAKYATVALIVIGQLTAMEIEKLMPPEQDVPEEPDWFKRAQELIEDALDVVDTAMREEPEICCNGDCEECDGC